MNRYRGPVALGMAFALVLSGCASQLPAPTGLTAKEIAVFEKAHNDEFWAQAALPADTPRPDVKVVRFLRLNDADWGYVMVQCLKQAGFADYVADSGGNMRYTGPDSPPSDARRLAMYVCQASYPYNPLDYQLLSAVQRDYLYSYFVRWLVPCLELNGFTIRKPPTRAKFVGDPFEVQGWNPYVGLRFPTDPAEMARLSDECPSTPAGLYPVNPK
jgi:hypothetical protein